MKKKVLIITYYWPPSGGPGVQRALKFAKYLPEYGWEPIILTIKNGEYPAIDESLGKDIPEGCKVFKTDAFEPSDIYRKFTGMKKGEKIPVANLAQKNISWKKRISNWVRLNLFIPDAKIGWIPYAVKQGKKIIEQEKPEIIFSTSPPPSVHLIAKKLAKWSGIKWVADFRDPWTDIYHYDGVNRLKLSRNYDLKLERKVISRADKVIVVSNSISESVVKNQAQKYKIETIPNGFDESDFKITCKIPKTKEFTICYSGKMNMQQNPENLWLVLSGLVKNNKDFAQNFQLKLIGNIENGIVSKLEQHGLTKHLNKVGYVSHTKLLKLLQQTDVLLLLIPNTKKNKGIVTGKIFEYLASKKFILGVGPEDGDASKVLKETGAGKMFEFSDFENLNDKVWEQFNNWKNNLQYKTNKEAFKKYSRRELTRNLVQIFEELVI